MPSPLQLRTFGDLVLERVHEGGAVETVYRSGKLLAVLLHLTIRRELPHRRAELADLFWGDEAPERARASLRQAIASLHRLLGETALVATRDAVQLADGVVRTDRERFIEGVRLGDVEAVMTLYRGPFLATEPRAGLEFERWVGAERLRLRRDFLTVMEGAVSEALRDGDVARATDLARAVRTAEPDAADGVRLLFDALGAGGRRSDARRVIEEFSDQLGRVDDALPPELVQRLARAREAQEVPRGEAGPGIDAASLGGLGSTLVGRDAILAELIAAAEQARLGVPRHLMLVGVSGSGKSRVLDEFESRLRLRGARAVRVRLLPTMRAVPFAGLAEILRALTTLPGAIGVSATTAATLVEFLPELRSEFPSAELPMIGESDLVRRRQEALLDLAAAVAERRPISLLIDDGQYLDASSVVVLRAILRLRELRFLLVLAAWTPVFDGTDAVEVLELPPLSEAQVRTMLEQVARWPVAPWVPEFLARLTATAHGLPQSVVQLIRAVQGDLALTVTGGSWVADDPARLLERVRDGHSLPIDLGTVSGNGRLLLRILSVWGRPVPDVALREIARALSLEASEEGCGVALEALESRGLVVSRASAWVIAHDTVAEALRDADDSLVRAEVRSATVRWWTAQDDMDLPTFEHLILLCAEGDDLPAARQAVSAITRSARWRRAQRLSASRLSNRLATAAGRPDWERSLYRSMGWVARRSRAELAWYSAAATMAIVGGLTLIALLWPRLRVEVEPLGEFFLPQRIGTLMVQPRVGVYDGFGRRYRMAGTVRVEGTGATRVIGDTVRALEDGQAQFRRLALTELEADSAEDALSPRPQRIRFRGSGLVVGTSAPVHGLVGWGREGIRIISATINGQRLDSALTVRLPVGVPLHVEVTFSYTTSAATANYVVGAGPTWLEPRSSVIRVAGLPRPVIDAWQSVEFDIDPATGPGHHHLVFLFKAEDSVEHLFSATNWVVGPPVWDDGNDVVTTLTEAKIDTLRRRGRVAFERYLRDRAKTNLAQAALDGIRLRPLKGADRLSYGFDFLHGTAIEIDFVARTP